MKKNKELKELEDLYLMEESMVFLIFILLGNLNLSRALGDLEYKRDNKLRTNE